MTEEKGEKERGRARCLFFGKVHPTGAEDGWFFGRVPFDPHYPLIRSPLVPRFPSLNFSAGHWNPRRISSREICRLQTQTHFSHDISQLMFPLLQYICNFSISRCSTILTQCITTSWHKIWITSKTWKQIINYFFTLLHLYRQPYGTIIQLHIHRRCSQWFYLYAIENLPQSIP